MESEIVDKWELLNFIWEVSYMKRVQSKKKKKKKKMQKYFIIQTIKILNLLPRKV